MVYSMAPVERVASGAFREALAAGTSLHSAVVFMFMILFDLQHVNVSLNYSFLKSMQIFKTPGALKYSCFVNQKIHPWYLHL